MFLPIYFTVSGFGGCLIISLQSFEFADIQLI